MRRVQVTEFLAGCKNALLLDVRSPGEYHHAHIPGAVNLPLFTDEERKVVGTTYKQNSREQAIKIGLDYFGPKMRGMVEEVEKLVVGCGPSNTVFVYCWRGGMRSGAVAWLLNLYGFNVTLLAGGYKTFRNYVLRSFESPYRFKVLGGYTGSGKTEILQELKNRGEKVIDLEAVASHKGSAFGNINMPAQPSQEMFENRLSLELSMAEGKMNNSSGNGTTPNPPTPDSCIWIEDESQRIGIINLPGAFWRTMRNSPLYFIDIPFEERLNHIEEEYSQFNRESLLDAIERIRKRLGGLDAKNAMNFLEEGNMRECFRILLHYYDKQYLKALQNRENLDALLTKVYSNNVSIANASLVSQVQSSSSYAGIH